MDFEIVDVGKGIIFQKSPNGGIYVLVKEDDANNSERVREATLSAAEWQTVTEAMGGAMTLGGLTVENVEVTVSAVRSRTLFSDPLVLVTGVSGKTHLPVFGLFSHGAGTNHTTTSVTGLAVTWSSDGAAALGVGTASVFANGDAAAFGIPGPVGVSGALYTNVGLATRAGGDLQLKTTGADLSGSGTYNITVSVDYITVDVPLTEV